MTSDAAPPRSSDGYAGSVREHLPAAAAGTGLLVVVIGTFLPWLRSGKNTRNSYQAGGALRRLLGSSGVVEHLVAVWPIVTLTCALSVAAYLVRLRAVSGLLAALSAVTAGAASIGALATTASPFARVTILGPATTLTGATLIALALLSRAILTVTAPRKSR